MISSLLFLFCFVAAPWFSPNVRIHQKRPGHSCMQPAIAVGPGAPSRPSIYVVYQDDSLKGLIPVNPDLVFQKSTDGGATWLAEDRILRHFDEVEWLQLDVMVDSDGNVYVVYSDRENGRLGHVYCIRSTDGGATWSEPVQVDDNVAAVNVTQARVAMDSSGNLFCAWGDGRVGRGHVWSSVSADRGTTWSANVRVSTDVNDTTRYGCANPDVFVQPGTNHYLVALESYYLRHPVAPKCVFLYRSTDGGLSFQPGVQLDTFNEYAGPPHVVADRDHIICDYTGDPAGTSGHPLAESRTFYTGPDTWGGVVAVHDTVLSSYYNGAKLAISPDGRVHTALMCSGITYTFSTDHGASWAGLTQVNDGGGVTQYPDIGVDSDGYAYVVWVDGREGRNDIWFSTNNPAAIAEETSHRLTGAAEANAATIVRGVLFLAERPSSSASTSSLFDTGGREVLDLSPGANDVSKLAPGVYFVRAVSRKLSTVSCQKVVVTR